MKNSTLTTIKTCKNMPFCNGLAFIILGFIVNGCTVLPQPHVDIPGLVYQGEIKEIKEPIEIRLSPVENIHISTAVS